MPHVDTFHFRESPFARPVATITALVRRWVGYGPAPATPRIRQDLDVRSLEERLAHAHDHADVERMERSYNRRDGGGLPLGDWR